MARNDSGINPLDEYCKEHDIAYTKISDRKERNKADKVLAKKAWQRARSSGKVKLSERIASAVVAGIIGSKALIGMGLKRKKQQQRSNGIRRRVDQSKNKKKKKRIIITPNKQKIIVKKLFNDAVWHAKQVIAAKKPKPLKNAVILARDAARKIINENKNMSKTATRNHLPRIIPIPKQKGGAIPVFAALSALGAIMGGTAGIVNAIKSSKNARKVYDETKRHNETMEAIAIGKKQNKNGFGLFLGPHKNGLGLFLNTADNIEKTVDVNEGDNVPKN